MLHALLEAKRAEEMHNWVKTIDVRGLFYEIGNAPTPEAVVELGKKLKEILLKEAPEEAKTPEFLDLADWFGNLPPTDSAIEFFDDRLEELYDWADEYRIWLGV